jgi:transposase
MQITTIGLDLAKHVFQVRGVDAAGQVMVRKSLRRAQMLPFFAKLPPCLVGIEACGTSHHWARELINLGHEVRLMPPAYVKPYVKRGKQDSFAVLLCRVDRVARSDDVRHRPQYRLNLARSITASPPTRRL